jgi:hypothetical protein
MLGESLEDPPRCHAIAIADACERLSNRGFDRPLSCRVYSNPPPRKVQYCAASITGIAGSSHKLLPHQSLKHTSESTGMYVQHRRKIAGRHARKQTDETQHEALRTGDANLACHLLRFPIQTMDDRPQELHELQYVWESDRISRFVLYRIRGHIILSSN